MTATCGPLPLLAVFAVTLAVTALIAWLVMRHGLRTTREWQARFDAVPSEHRPEDPSAGRLRVVPDEPGPDQLDGYRGWLADAQRDAARHATMLSDKLASHPHRDDQRWCLLHQAIGRAGAYRAALDRLPVPGPRPTLTPDEHRPAAGLCDDELEAGLSGFEGLPSYCVRPLGHRGWHGDGGGLKWRIKATAPAEVDQ